MKLRKTLAAAGALAIAGSLAYAAPSQADTCTELAADAGTCTDITFTVSRVDLLSIATDTASKAFASTDFSGADSVGGALGTVTVTDNRNTVLEGWSATAESHPFDLAGGTAGNEIPCENVTVTADAVSIVTGPLLGEIADTSTLLDNVTTGCLHDLVTLPAADTLLTATELLGLTSGNNSATFTTAVNIVIPATAPDGDYAGAVVYSVS
jgi:hypothetical protein